MIHLRIDYDQTAGQLLVGGDVDVALKRPIVATYIRNLGGVSRGGNLVSIPTTVPELDRRFRSFREILSRAGISCSLDDGASQSLADAERRDELFLEFAARAAQIWSDDFSSVEFGRFCEVLAERCPGTTFYRLQLLSAYHLAFSQNACNFSVPGAGKTRIVYGAYAFLNSLPPTDRRYVNGLVVVGPLSSFRAWEGEYRETFQRAVRSKRLSGVLDRGERQAFLAGQLFTSPDEVELLLTSYQSLTTSIDDFVTLFRRPGRKWMIVLDEAHNIKREDGVWADAALRLAPHGTSRVVLTGTPAPNGYEDLENLFRFIYPERNVVGFQGSALKAMSAGTMRAAVPALRQNLQPFFTRIRKRDLGLPPFTEEVVRVPFGGAQDAIYRQIERATVPQLEHEIDSFTASLVQARLIRLRQAATNPALLMRPLEESEFGREIATNAGEVYGPSIAEAVSQFDASTQLPKLERLKELIRSNLATHQRILIWSVFIENLNLIEHELQGLADEVMKISGATPIQGDAELPEDYDNETRERIIDRFLSHPGTAVLVANPQAIGESISLHSTCHVAIYFDRDFNAGRFIQSKDRIHRYGLQPNQQTHYYYLVSAGSVEEDIHQRLSLKETRLMDLIESDDIPLFRIALGEDEGREDIRAVIQSYERRKVA